MGTAFLSCLEFAIQSPCPGSLVLPVFLSFLTQFALSLRCVSYVENVSFETGCLMLFILSILTHCGSL